MVNKVILVGNVGIDPEVRTTESGVKVARIRLATTERLFDRQANEAKEHTEWHTVTLWRGLADVVDKYVRKGTQIYVEGRLRTREWMDKDNNKRYTTEILADVMNLLGRRSDNPASDGAPSGYGSQQQAPAYGQPAQGGAQQPAAQQPAAPVQQQPTAQKGSFCANCGEQLTPGAKFCPNCGQKQETANVCPSCGQKVQPGAKFCANCGQKL